MKKFRFTLFLILSVTVSLTAQENSLLWKIEHEKLRQPSYLYGTIHLICTEDITEQQAVNQALKSVEKVVFELDFSDPQLQQKMMQAQMNTGDPITHYLNDKEKKILDNYFKEHAGAGIQQLANLKPFALTVVAMQSMIQCSEKLYSFEGALLMQARELSLSVVGLETPEFQFGLFDSIPVEDQINELVAGVLSPDSVQMVFKNIKDQYLKQDIESLYKTFIDSPSGSYQKEILDERNRAWIPKIGQLMDKESIFVAVGAGHLAGKNGIIEMLRARGYTVTPVR